MSPEQAIVLVQRFFADLARRDVDALVAYFTDDAVFHDMPRERFSGREAIAARLRAMPNFTELRIEVGHVVAQGEVVLSERVDYLVLNGKSVRLPVMAAMELRNGKIAAWRDYWDAKTTERQLRDTPPRATEEGLG